MIFQNLRKERTRPPRKLAGRIDWYLRNVPQPSSDSKAYACYVELGWDTRFALYAGRVPISSISDTTTYSHVTASAAVGYSNSEILKKVEMLISDIKARVKKPRFLGERDVFFLRCLHPRDLESVHLTRDEYASVVDSYDLNYDTDTVIGICDKEGYFDNEKQGGGDNIS